jgi:hypothetical protein
MLQPVQNSSVNANVYRRKSRFILDVGTSIRSAAARSVYRLDTGSRVRCSSIGRVKSVHFYISSRPALGPTKP